MSDVSGSSDPAERRPLLPGQVPGHAAQDRGLFGNVKVDLIPFGSLWRGLAHSLGFRRDVRTPEGRRVDVETGMGVDEAPGGGAPNGDGILAGAFPHGETRRGWGLLTLHDPICRKRRRTPRGARNAPRREAHRDVRAARDHALEAPPAHRRGRGEPPAGGFEELECVGECAGRARGRAWCGAWGDVGVHRCV